MKGMVVFLAIMVIAVILNQEAFADDYWLPKEQKQPAAAVFLLGFVGVYGMMIYLRKSQTMNVFEK